MCVLEGVGVEGLGACYRWVVNSFVEMITDQVIGFYSQRRVLHALGCITLFYHTLEGIPEDASWCDSCQNSGIRKASSLKPLAL